MERTKNTDEKSSIKRTKRGRVLLRKGLNIVSIFINPLSQIRANEISAEKDCAVMHVVNREVLYAYINMRSEQVELPVAREYGV